VKAFKDLALNEQVVVNTSHGDIVTKYSELF